MKSFRKIIGISLALIVAVTACKKPMDEIKHIDYDRAFIPSNIRATPSETTAFVTWNQVTGVEEYVVQISQDSMVFGIILHEYTTDSLQKTITGLDGSTQYSVRVRSVSAVDGQNDSKWNAIAFKTTEEQLMYDVDPSTIKKNQATVTWLANTDATHLRIRPLNGTYYDSILTPDDIAAGEKQLQNLSPGTEYTVDLYRNSARRGRVTFTTLSIPSGPNVVTLALGDNLKDAMQDPANVGKTIYLPEGFSYTIGGAVTPVNGLTIYGDPDNHPQIILGTSKALELPASLDSLIFVNVKLTTTSASSAYYFINQSAAAQVGKLAFENCIISDFGNNLIRLQNATGEKRISKFIVNNSIVDNCGTASLPNGSYAFINSNIATGFVDDIIITNSTFTNMYHCLFNLVGASNVCSGDKITMENVTFYNIIGAGGSRYLIDGNTYGAMTISLKNIILGKTTDNAARGIRNGATGNISVDNVYRTADHITTNPPADPPVNYDVPSTTSYSGISADLWVDPANGNFRFKDNSFAGKSTTGDPRWR